MFEIKTKAINWIVLNYANEKDAGMDSSTNRVIIFNNDGARLELKKDRKDRIAKRILEFVMLDKNR